MIKLNTPPLLAETICILLLLIYATTVAVADSEQELPECDRQDACYCEAMPSRSFNMFCSHQLNYTFRMSYTAPRADLAAAVVLWCNPMTMERDHYQQLYSYNMTLGSVESVVFLLCPLPAGRLEDFFDRLGIADVQLLKVMSHSLYNDTMPGDFLHGSNVSTLQLDSLANIQLHTDFFKTTPGLENLTITGSSLQTLPYDLFRNTPRLGRLGLTNNKLEMLPMEVFDGLNYLWQLSLGNNRLNNLTSRHFRDLGILRQLDLYKNHINTLSDDVFFHLQSLETLRMNFNPLQSLPEKLFERTPNLRLLKLNGGNSNTNFSIPPAGLFRGLTQLELLMMDRLNIQELPEGLFDDLTALANLTLDHNRLEAVAGGTFSSLNNLRNLDLSWNQMTAVPADLLIGLHRLDTIYLNHNRLQSMPDDMFSATPQLERLFLHYNNISQVVVRTFSGLSRKLRLLRMEHNRIELDGSGLISPAFQELIHLQELKLSHNQISFLTQDLLSNLLHLRILNLRFNKLQSLSFDDLNFLTQNAIIDMRNNNISRIAFPIAPQKVEGNDERQPNTFLLEQNPLNCDCSVLSLKNYMDRTGAFSKRDKLDQLFELKVSQLECYRPERLREYLFAQLGADQLLCPLQTDCPEGCVCQKQSSTRTVLVTCGPMPSGSPLPTRLPKPPYGYVVNMHLERSSVRRLSNLSVTSAPVAGLFLSHNNLTKVPVENLPPELRTLQLDHNQMKTVSSDLLDYLNRSRTQVAFGHNPYICDCRLRAMHEFVQLDGREGFRRILDPGDIFCAQQNKTLFSMLPEELCPGVASAVIAVCVVAAAMGMCLLVAAVVYYNYSETIKVWLYARRWCMCWVSEADLDTDKKYDAFVSYSHLDESFVVEELVPHLERGEPRYKLCLHFRDWLAGEWIADQIQRSVQDSRRVIVVMSENYIQSEWGRLEFLAAHKQALNDKTNRVIVIVYGELPSPEAMDPELKMYISMNTYLKWGDALFWERLRYALPHKGRQLKKRRRRRLTSDKLGLIIRETSSAGSTPTVTPTTVGLPPATNGNISIISNGNVNGNGIIAGHLNSCFVPDKLGTINESRLREQLADNVV